jgi:Ca2+/Na+ antiporter
MIVRLGIVLFMAYVSLDFVCANLIAVGKVTGSVINNFLIFLVTQFVVSSWQLMVTRPVGPS